MNYLIVAFCCFTLLGCSEKDPGPFGSFDAIMNGYSLTDRYNINLFRAVAQSENASAGCKNPVSLYFRFRDSGGRERVSFSWHKSDLSLGKFPVNGRQIDCDKDLQIGSRLFTIIEGDVLGNIYNVDPNADNFFELSSYNESTNELAGSFQITFVILGNKAEMDFPDTLRFTEARFTATLFPDR